MSLNDAHSSCYQYQQALLRSCAQRLVWIDTLFPQTLSFAVQREKRMARARCTQALRDFAQAIVLPYRTYDADKSVLDHYRCVIRAMAHYGAVGTAVAPATARTDGNTVRDHRCTPQGVAYSRYESVVVRHVEQQWRQVFAPTPQHALIATASGMAAHALLEGYLTRHVLAPGDRLYAPRYVYFEAEEQWRALSAYTWIREDLHTVEAIVARVCELQPRVVFLDALTNTRDARFVHLPTIISMLAARYHGDVILVTDTTLLWQPLPAITTGTHGRVIVMQWSSASKYLTLGTDLTTAGFLITPHDWEASIRHLCRNSGLGLTEAAAWLCAPFSREAFLDRMARIDRNARRFCARFFSHPEVPPLVPRFPHDERHPDYHAAMTVPQLGGLITFVPAHHAVAPNNAELRAYTDRIFMHAAHAGVPLTMGVSFGMSTPRISVSLAMAGGDYPFLRLSMGDGNERDVDALADVMYEALMYAHAPDSAKSLAPVDSHLEPTVHAAR